MPPHTPQRQWTQRFRAACAQRRADRLRELEVHRRAHPQGLELLAAGVLGQACAVMDPWAVEQALGWNLPLPDMDAVLFRWAYASPKTSAGNPLSPHPATVAGFLLRAQAVWDLLLPHLSSDALAKGWTGLLNSSPDPDRAPHWRVEPFLRAGVDPNGLMDADRPQPLMGRQGARQGGTGKPLVHARWTPLFAAQALDQPERAQALLAAGADPWTPVPGNLIPGWTLAQDLGLAPSPHAPAYATDPDRAHRWETVRSAILALGLERQLPGPATPLSPPRL